MSYQIGRLNQLNGQLERAIEAYQDFIDNYPESIWRNEGIYQQAVCYRDIHEFVRAYYGFKTYMRLGRDERHYMEIYFTLPEVAFFEQSENVA